MKSFPRTASDIGEHEEIVKRIRSLASTLNIVSGGCSCEVTLRFAELSARADRTGWAASVDINGRAERISRPTVKEALNALEGVLRSMLERRIEYAQKALGVKQ
jgi:hypothetical protein